MSLVPPTAEPVSFPPAELDRRFSAFVLDRAVGWGIAAGVGVAVWWFAARDGAWIAILSSLGAVVLIGLVTAIVVGTTGLTPGKALVGLRVVRRTDGRPLGVLPAIGRSAALGLAGIPTVGMGLATLAWTAAADPTRQRRALHDRIGDAVVVDVRPMPVAAEEVDDRPHQIVNLTAMRLVPVPPPEPMPTPVPAAAPAPVIAPVLAPTPAPEPLVAAAPPGAHRAPTAPPTAPPTVPPAVLPAVPPAVPPAASPVRAPAPAAPPVVRPATEQTHIRPGTPSAPPPAAPSPAAPAPPAVRWRVSFDSGEEFVVEGLALVGRRPEPRAGEPVRHVVPLRSSDMSLSKTHAQFQVAPDGALVVMDRGSTNGSFVVRGGMSKSLTPGRPSTLLAGDVVRFGDRMMRVERAS